MSDGEWNRRSTLYYSVFSELSFFICIVHTASIRAENLYALRENFL